MTPFDGWFRHESSDIERENEQAVGHLLEGLRTTIPAATVLFAFLLVLPFNGAARSLEEEHEVAYLVAFASAALSTILLIAPSVQQRVHWLRRRNFGHKTLSLGIALWMAVAGTTFLGISLVTVVYLVTSTLVGETAGVVSLTVAVAIAVIAWFILPVVVETRATGNDGAEPEGDSGGASRHG